MMTKNDDGTFTFSPSFDLNDQITKFRIEVDLFTSSGKYATATKTLKSAVDIYSQYELPPVLVRQDRVTIPIKLVNNSRIPMP